MSRPMENRYNHDPVGAGISNPLQPGQVQNVCRQWLVHEDSALAMRLQDDEFVQKQNRNCEERRVARQDVRLVRQVQNADEEQLRFLQQRVRDAADDDALFAERLQSEEFIRKERERVTTELKDEEIARRLQDKEKKRYDLRVKEKELRRQRKMLEAELKRESSNLLETNISGVADMMISSSAMEVPIPRDVGAEGFSRVCAPSSSNLSERERKELQHLQDEEFARRLQAEECKQQVNKDKLKEIEMRDAELAKIMQEQEHVKRQRRRSHHRQRDSRQSSDPCHSTEPPFVDTRQSHSLPQPHEDPLHANHEEFLQQNVLPTTRMSNIVPLQGSQMTNYTTRPLPDKPSSDLPRGCNMSLLRALDRDVEQQSSDVLSSNVHQLCANRDARRVPLVLSDDDEDLLLPPLSQAPHAPTSSNGNIFAKIDPTWNPGHDQHAKFNTEEPTHSGVAITEDGYCDLEDVRAMRVLQAQDNQDLEMVPGQRRQPFNRDNRRASGRKANCKQQ